MSITIEKGGDRVFKLDDEQDHEILIEIGGNILSIEIDGFDLHLDCYRIMSDSSVKPLYKDGQLTISQLALLLSLRDNIRHL